MEIKGKLTIGILDDMFTTFSENGESGSLIISTDTNKVTTSLYFKKGDLCWINSSQRIPFELAVFKVKKISKDEFEKINKIKESVDKPLKDILMQLKILTQNELLDIFKQQLLEQVYEIYTWDKANYEFKPERLSEEMLKKVEQLKISIDIDNLIKEGNRWGKKAKRVKDNILKNKQLIFMVDEDLESKIQLLPDEEKKMMNLIDGVHNITEIIKKSALSESEVIEMLYTFALRDVIFVKKDIYKYITFL